jgi:hypothetical protein
MRTLAEVTDAKCSCTSMFVPELRSGQASGFGTSRWRGKVHAHAGEEHFSTDLRACCRPSTLLRPRVPSTLGIPTPM